MLQRHPKISLLCRGGEVQGALGGWETPFAHGHCGIDEFARGRDDVDGSQRPSQAARTGGASPEHLKGQVRKTVSKGPQRQVLKDDISSIPIGGGLSRTFDGFDQRIGQLVGSTGIEPRGQGPQIEGVAIGPDPAQPRDLSLADGDGEAHRVGIAHLFRGPLPDRTALSMLPEARGPDQLTRHPHTPIDQRQTRPFPAVHEMETLQPGPLPRRRQTGIDGLPDHSPKRAAQCGPRHRLSKNRQALRQEVATYGGAHL